MGLLAAGPVVFALIALVLGKKTGWDFFNYHWYNPFALLSNRFGFDVAVAHHATYYNPLPDLPLYIIASHGPAWLGGLFLGALAGVVVSLTGAIAYCVLPILDERRRLLVATSLALAGACGAGAFQEIGDPANDIPTGIGSLVALLMFVSQIERLQRVTINAATISILFIAGLCAGAGVGLKLTTAIYAVGIAVALATISGSLMARMLRPFFFGLGTLAGMIIFGGFWMLRLWRYSGNPFFPYFNDLINSPLLIATGYFYTGFHPESWTMRLLFPFFFTADSHYVSESGFRDAHILALYILIPLSTLLALVWRPRSLESGWSIQWQGQTSFLFVFAGASYFVWLILFDVYRYLIPLEMLSPLLIALAFMLWPMRSRMRVTAIVAALAILQSVVQIDLKDRQPWTGPYVKVEVPALPDPTHTMIVMAGHAAMAFVIPSFSREIPFVRIDSWLVPGSDQTTGLAQIMRARVAAHQGPLYVLYSPLERDDALAAVENYELLLDPDNPDCAHITSNIADPLALCPVFQSTQRK